MVCNVRACSIMSYLSGIFRFVSNRSFKLNKICGPAFSSKVPPRKIVKEIDPNTGEVKTKKVDALPKITLLLGDKLEITTLPEAEKLSKRRDLKLVKVIDLDAKTMRPVYKLMTGSEYHAEDLKQRENKKQQKHSIRGEKVLLINSKIAQHDLDTQLRKAVKWIKRMYEVRVIISGASGSIQSSEKVYSSIEEFFKNAGDAKLVQKQQKGADIKFQILPLRNEVKIEKRDDL